jgi:putative Mg2+ transporter-C (MgtC) family protein
MELGSVPVFDGFDWHEFVDVLICLAVATALGGVVGLERQLKDQWAGLRTHMMVSLGAAVFTIVGTMAAAGDPQTVTRVIQGVATGIGFLGAGTILKLSERREIRGLTTAASIWLAAGIGTAAGLGHYSLAAAAALVSLFVLAILRRFEREFIDSDHDHPSRDD